MESINGEPGGGAFVQLRAPDSAEQDAARKVAAPTTRPSKDADRIIGADAASPNPAHGEPPADDSNRDDGADTIVDLPDVAWISARDGTRHCNDYCQS